MGPNIHVYRRLRLLKLPTLVYLRLIGDKLEVYKITHNIYDDESVSNHLGTMNCHKEEETGHTL